MKKMVNVIRNGYFLLSSAVAIITTIIVFNAPNTIPIHYDLNGIADSYSSRWIFLILPFALVTQAIYWKTKIKQELAENKISIIISAYAISVFFSGFSLFFAVRLIQKNLTILNIIKRINIYSFLSILAGITFIIMAYAVSKSVFDSSFGIKTVWSSTDKACWSKTQNSCKVLFLFSGLLMILQAFIFKGFTCLALLIIEVLILAFLCVLLSYFIWRRCKII